MSFLEYGWSLNEGMRGEDVEFVDEAGSRHAGILRP